MPRTHLCLIATLGLTLSLASQAETFERSTSLVVPDYLTIEQAKQKAVEKIRQSIELESGHYTVGSERIHDDRYSSTSETVTAATIRVTPMKTSIDASGESVRLHMTAEVHVDDDPDLRHLSVLEENARLRTQVATSPLVLEEPDIVLGPAIESGLNERAVMRTYRMLHNLWTTALDYPLEKDIWVVSDRRATEGYVEVGISWQLNGDWIRDMLYQSVGLNGEVGSNSNRYSHRLPVTFIPAFRNKPNSVEHRVGSITLNPPDHDALYQKNMERYEQLRHALANLPVTGVLRVGDEVRYIPISPGVGLKPGWNPEEAFQITVSAHPEEESTMMPSVRNPLRIETDDTGPLGLRFDIQLGHPPMNQVSGVAPTPLQQ